MTEYTTDALITLAVCGVIGLALLVVAYSNRGGKYAVRRALIMLNSWVAGCIVGGLGAYYLTPLL